MVESPSDVERWAAFCGIPPSSIPIGFEWKPETLKQISVLVLRLGKETASMQAVMKRLGDIELRLKKLRVGIGLARDHPTEDLPRVVVLRVMTKGGIAGDTKLWKWTRLGRWIPDVLDRAGAFDPFQESTPQDLDVTLEELKALRLDHIILVDDGWATPKGRNQDEDRASLSQSEPFLYLTSHLPHVRVHPCANTRAWLGSGPDVFNAVFEAAFLCHGFRE